MSEPFLGEVIMFGGNFAPRNWAFCDGQLLPIQQHQALFSILGTIYGGDGQTTFALPDLRGRVPVGAGQGTGLTNHPLGQKSGWETVALTESDMPAHTHEGDVSMSATLSGHAGSNADSAQPWPGTVLSNNQAIVGVNTYSDSEANLTEIGGVASLNVTVDSAGGGQPHENRQPLLAVNYIIALFGIFPPRN